jgi:hypothetical protein
VFQQLFTAGAAFGSTFNSRHRSFSWCGFEWNSISCKETNAARRLALLRKK